MTVTVVQASRHCFEDQLNLAGFLVPSNEMLVRPEVEGLRISEILVENGQKVQEGQVLAHLVRPDNSKANGPVTKVTSPAAGIVSFKAGSVGRLVTTKGEPLFRIAVGGTYDAEADVPASLHQKIKPGQKTRVTLWTEDLDGRVKEKSFTVDPVTQLGRVRVSITSEDTRQAGVFVKIVVFAGESCGMTVPLSAILYGPGGAFLQVLNDNKIETRRVRVGFISGNSAEIREGVNDNDVVVAKAGAFLREGDTVKPVLFDSYKGRNAGLAVR